MNKILISLAIIGIVGGAAIGLTTAYFSDTETSTGNTFTAGYLDLKFTAPNDTPFTVSDLMPGDNGTEIITLHNASGSATGNLSARLINLVQSENVIIEPELKAGDYENGGDLHLSLEFAAYLDVNRDGVFNAGDIQLTYNGQQKAYPGFWDGDFHYHPISGMMNGGWNNIITMSGDSYADFVLMWRLPTTWTYPNYSQNIVMTDILGFDIQTSLEQIH